MFTWVAVGAVSGMGQGGMASLLAGMSPERVSDGLPLESTGTENMPTIDSGADQ